MRIREGNQRQKSVPIAEGQKRGGRKNSSRGTVSAPSWPGAGKERCSHARSMGNRKRSGVIRGKAVGNRAGERGLLNEGNGDIADGGESLRDSCTQSIRSRRRGKRKSAKKKSCYQHWERGISRCLEKDRGGGERFSAEQRGGIGENAGECAD